MAKIRRLYEDFSVVAARDVKVVMPLNIDRCPNVVKAIHCSFTFLDMLQLLNNVAVTFCWRVFVFSMDSGPCPPKPDQFEPKLLWSVAVTPSFCILCASWTPQFPSISWKFLGTPASAMECNVMYAMYVCHACQYVYVYVYACIDACIYIYVVCTNPSSSTMQLLETDSVKLALRI